MKIKRILSGLLVFSLLLTLLPLGSVSAASDALTLAELREKYPHGAYWNHPVGSPNNAGGYTWTPCNHHNGNCSYGGSCGCNSYIGMAIQCMGFAYQLASLAYDCDPRTSWSTNYNPSALDGLKAGDIVRYNNNGHSIFVIGVSGETVIYADCNSDLHCKIKWDQTISKSTLRASFTYVKSAPYALVNSPSGGPGVLTLRYHAGGGTIVGGGVVGSRYTVTDPEGINLRSGAGTSNSVLTAIPYKAVFGVRTGDTKKANGYTWGKTTYKGATGWAVISKFVERTGDWLEGTYYLNNSLVYRSSDTSLVTRTADYGSKVTLDDAATFKLEKENYRFLGWSTEENGELIASGTKAEEICPELVGGNASVTLYAVWGCDHQYSNTCDATCNRCGASRKTEHQYDGVCDPACNLCEAVRKVEHTYTAPCAETCSVCGTLREAEPHTYKNEVCTVCGKVVETVSIITQPAIGYAPMGEQVTTTVKAVGDGLTYQWYVRNEGQSKYYKSSVTGATYFATMSAKSKNRRVLCYVYDRYGNRVQTKTTILRETVSITTHPKNVTVAKGKTAKVTVKASGDGLIYKWYLKNAGGTKYSKSSITSASYSVKMSDKVHGRRLICYVYDKYGNKVQSQTVILKQK